MCGRLKPRIVLLCDFKINADQFQGDEKDSDNKMAGVEAYRRPNRGLNTNTSN